MFKRKISAEIDSWDSGAYDEYLILRGARGVGKTEVLRDFITRRYEHTLVLDLSGRDAVIFDGDVGTDPLIARMGDVHPEAEFVPGSTAFLFDRVDLCPRAREAMVSLTGDGRYRVVATASLPDAGTPASRSAGHERVMVMRSMDFEEFLWALGLDEEYTGELRRNILGKKELGRSVIDATGDAFRSFVMVGGMPAAVAELLGSGDMDAVMEVQKGILENYRNEIGMHSRGRIRDRAFGCLDSVPSQLAGDRKRFMYCRVDGKCAASAASYGPALRWLSDADIVSVCPGLDEPVTPPEEHVSGTLFKVHMQDTGLMVSMLGLEAHKAVLHGGRRYAGGALAENIVAECLSKSGLELYYFPTKTFEIDLMTVIDGKMTAVEVKSGNNRRSKSLASMRDKYGVRRRIVFESTDILVTGDGVEHYPLFASAFIGTK